VNPQERKDQPPSKDLDTALVVAFADTFISRSDIYPLQLENGRYSSIKAILHTDLLAAHLKGFITIGAYALNEQHMAKWICFDADDDLRWRKLNQLAYVLTEQNVTPYLEPSRRGGRLWLFTTPLLGADIRRFGRQLLADHKLDKLKIEIYPKQDQLVTGPGSFVRLPLGKHRITGVRYHFITPDGQPLKSSDATHPSTRDQIKLLTNPDRVPQEFLDRLLEHAPIGKLHSPTPSFEPIPEPPKKAKKKRRQRFDGKLSERIKTVVSVREFVSQYVKLDEEGHGFCPFHDDQHRSFGVNTDHNFWHCFAEEECGKPYGGSIIDFWMRWRKVHGEDGSFKTTIKDLAHKLLK
jgi:hypothetical protein